VVSGGCVHKGLYNGSLTTDDGNNFVLKFSDHNHKGITDLINAETAKFNVYEEYSKTKLRYTYTVSNPKKANG